MSKAVTLTNTVKQLCPQLYKTLLKKAYRVTRNVEDSEDAVHNAVLKLLTAKTEVRSASYYSLAVLHNCYQLMKKNRKYIQGDLQIEALVCEPIVRDVYALAKLQRSLTKLTNKEHAVVSHLISYSEIRELPGNYNTNKCHYFGAIKKLREEFSAA